METAHEPPHSSQIKTYHRFTGELRLRDQSRTSRKKAFIVGSERPLSLVFESTLTQETLIQTSVEEPTSHSSPQRRLRPDNRRHDFIGTCKHKKHHVGFGTKPTWCFLCLQV